MCTPDMTARADESSLHFVYIVRCADGTLYTGYARNPVERARVHNAGRGARYTSGRRPVALVHSESFTTKGCAAARTRAEAMQPGPEAGVDRP